MSELSTSQTVRVCSICKQCGWCKFQVVHSLQETWSVNVQFSSFYIHRRYSMLKALLHARY